MVISFELRVKLNNQILFKKYKILILNIMIFLINNLLKNI